MYVHIPHHNGVGYLTDLHPTIAYQPGCGAPTRRVALGHEEQLSTQGLGVRLRGPTPAIAAGYQR
jgi:hypothetical protein